jgi:hypothetical protein
MVALKDGNYSHVPIDTLLGGTQERSTSTGLYDPATYRAR